MYDLGEVAGGVVGRQKRELRAAGRRDTRDTPLQDLSREGVDGDLDGLAGFDARELRLLVVGDDVDVGQRHHVEQVAADIDVIARLHLTRADDAVEWRGDPGIAELELCGLQRGLRRENVGGALLLGAGENFELMLLGGDHSAAGAHIGLRLGEARDGLF